MSDLAAIGIFFACLISTLVLVRVCDWLRPRTMATPNEPSTKQSSSSTLNTEARP